MKRDAVIDFLNGYLKSAEIRDASQNGLQVEGRSEVKKIVFGVSASLELFRRAAAAGADMIITHHGLLWGRPLAVKGPFRSKLALLLDRGISLAAWHLPLDRHPISGNNARLMNMLGARNLKPFGIYDGQAIGFKGGFSRPKTVREITGILGEGLGSRCLAFARGPEKIRTLGVVSGGAASLLEQAAAEKLDLYITGEAAESSQEAARENGINFLAAGHYNTEKTGVQALALLLRARFRLRTEFIDIPNPV